MINFCMIEFLLPIPNKQTKVIAYRTLTTFNRRTLIVIKLNNEVSITLSELFWAWKGGRRLGLVVA